jgi:hypothetical protein
MSDHPARVYVDESYGDSLSFLVQTAITLPAGDAEAAFNQTIEAKIAENPRFDRDEFKARDVGPKNRHVFQWFLQQAVNVLALVGDHTPCRTVISIDGMGNYKTDVYNRLYEQLKGSLSDIGYHPAEEIGHARDFIRQVIWLHARLPKLVPPLGAGGVELLFDDKYGMDKLFEEDITAWVPKNGAKVRFVEKRWKAYTRLLQILLRVLPTTKQFPEVSKFTYIDSKSNYLIQAADLFSNLTLNAIKHRAGVTNDLIRQKYEMLCSVMDRDPVDSELLAAFDVTTGQVRCRDQDWFSSMTLDSGPAT